MLEIVRQCLAEIHTTANGDIKAKNIVIIADNYFSQQKEKIVACNSLALLDAMFIPMCNYKDDIVENIEAVTKPVEPPNAHHSLVRLQTALSYGLDIYYFHNEC